jgi:predicted RNase H-like HicB family nuclease
MATRLMLTAVYEPVEEGWTQARIQELPAVITAAPTLDEAKKLLVDALQEYLLSLGPQHPDKADADATGAATRLPVEIVIQAA